MILFWVILVYIILHKIAIDFIEKIHKLLLLYNNNSKIPLKFLNEY